MNPIALVLADSRFPGGGHVHSGGLEEAAARGLVTDQASLAAFLRGRLRTAGALAAVFAAAAAHAARRGVVRRHWLDLDAELDARTPSPAARAASRAQGAGMIRATRAGWTPGNALETLLAATPRPHQPIALGVLLDTPHAAALTAAYLAISGPAAAAVRLLGLDPFGVNAEVVALSADLTTIADQAAATAGADPADLPAPGAPALDLLAEAHNRAHREKVRLFAS
jgi:urease accessory protein